MTFRLLVVDDSKIMRMVIRKELSALFANREHEISECATADDAFERCSKESFDLVLTDLTMPGMSGYELLEKLGKIGLRDKVIVLSADIQIDAAKRVRNLGAIAFLQKPLTREAIQAVLIERHFL